MVKRSLSTPGIREASSRPESSMPPPVRSPGARFRPAIAAALAFGAFVAYAFLAPTEYEASARISVSTPRGREAELAPAQAKMRLLGLLLGAAKRSGSAASTVHSARELAQLERVGSSLEVDTVDALVFHISLKDREAVAAAEACNFAASYAAEHVLELFPKGSSARVLQVATVPTEPSWPNRPLLLLFGVAAGALAAALTIFGATRKVASVVGGRRDNNSDSPPPISSRKSVRLPVAAKQELDLPSPSSAMQSPLDQKIASPPPPLATPSPQANVVPTAGAIPGAGVIPAAGAIPKATPEGRRSATRPHIPQQRTMTQAFGSPVYPSDTMGVSGQGEPAPKITLFQTNWKPNHALEPDLRAPLCDQILAEAGSGCTVVGVTSAPQFFREKSLVAVELALILANIGEPRVLLVEGDFLGANVHQLLGLEVPWAAGFSQQLQVREAQSEEPWRLAECLRTLHVLAEGAMRSPGAILSHQFEQCIRKLRSAYDFIVIDGPPLSAEVDCQALNEVTDGVVLITRAGDLRGRGDDRRTMKFDGKRFLIEEDF